MSASRGGRGRGRDNYLVWAFGRAFLYQVLFGVLLYLMLGEPSARDLDRRLGWPIPWPLVHGLGMLTALGVFHGGKSLVYRCVPLRHRAPAFLALMISHACVDRGLDSLAVPDLPDGRFSDFYDSQNLMNYSWLLLVHGATRWLVLYRGCTCAAACLAGAFAVGNGRVSMRSRTLVSLAYSTYSFCSGLRFTESARFRLAACAAPGPAMSSEMGFFAFLHPALMVAAIVVAHVGRALSKRAETPVLKQERLWKFYLAALILIAMAVPWWRPFSRF